MNFAFVLLVVVPAALGALENNKNSSRIIEEKNQLKPNSILTYSTVYTDCGGVIPLSPLTGSDINYKYGELYNPHEFCVWTLLSQDTVTNVHVTVNQNMSDSPDGIIAYFLNDSGLTSYKLPGNNVVVFDFNTPLAFLVFSSNDRDQSNGFTIWIGSTGVSGSRSSGAYHVRKDEGEFSYPIQDPTKNGQKSIALVLQRKSVGYVNAHLAVSLRNVNVDESDSIKIFSFNNYAGSACYANVGRFTADAEVEVHSFYPVLILLESRNKLKGKGFQVKWKKFVHSIE